MSSRKATTGNLALPYKMQKPFTSLNMEVRFLQLYGLCPVLFFPHSCAKRTNTTTTITSLPLHLLLAIQHCNATFRIPFCQNNSIWRQDSNFSDKQVKLLHWNRRMSSLLIASWLPRCCAGQKRNLPSPTLQLPSLILFLISRAAQFTLTITA